MILPVIRGPGGGSGLSFAAVGAVAWGSPSFAPDVDGDSLFNSATFDVDSSAISVSSDKFVRSFASNGIYWYLDDLSVWSAPNQVLEVTIRIDAAPSSRTTNPCLAIMVNDGGAIDGNPAIWAGVAYRSDGTSASICKSQISTGVTFEVATVTAADVAAVRIYAGPSAAGDIWCPAVIQLLDSDSAILDQAMIDDGSSIGIPGRLAFCLLQPSGTADATPITFECGVFYRVLGNAEIP